MTFRGTLYGYQDESLDHLFSQDGRGILVLPPGAGKTPTALAAIEELMELGEITEPGFIVTLSTLKYQWAKSIEKFTDSRALVIDGPPKKRAQIYAEAAKWQEDGGADYFVINYNLLATDVKQLEKLPKGFWVWDESQSVSNVTTKRHKAAKALSGGSRIHLGLTGTPMTRGKPEQLFGQLRIIDPSVLGTSLRRFRERYVVTNGFGWDVGYTNLSEMHEKSAKALYVVEEDDPRVLAVMPKVLQRDTFLVGLDRAGRKLYERIRKELVELLDGMVDGMLSGEGYADSEKGSIGQRVAALRMLLDHPQLLRISAARFNDGDDTRGSEYIAQLESDGALDGLKASPKMDALVRYVKEFLELDEANKVVVFTAFVPMVDLLVDAFGKTKSVKLTGEMSSTQKEASRDAFNEDPEVRLFISSDAGGVGVDLPRGNLLVNLDLPWTSGQQQQRDGRIKRASSAWGTVTVQNFAVAGSLEERLEQSLAHQRRVGEAVTRGGVNSLRNDVSSLRTFLKASSV